MAPTTITSSRPSRQTKIPKKFADFEGYFPKTLPTATTAPAPVDSDSDDEEEPQCFSGRAENLQDIQDVREATQMLMAKKKKDIPKAILMITMSYATLDTLERFNVRKVVGKAIKRAKLEPDIVREINYLYKKMWRLGQNRKIAYGMMHYGDMITSEFNESNS